MKSGAAFRLLLAAATLLALSELLPNTNNHIHTVQCSSYLDDYFLPTAKLALNKIQQSLSQATPAPFVPESSPLAQALPAPTNSSETSTSATTTNATTTFKSSPAPIPTTPIEVATATTTETSTTTKTATAVKQQSQANNDDSDEDKLRKSDEPKQSEFVKLDTASAEIQPIGDAVVSSTVATDSDPTSSATTVATASSATEQANPDPINGLQNGNSPVLVVETPVAHTESELSAEEAIKETEMRAVAAVDASIGFGSDLFSSMSDSCYDEYGNARYCEPEFENIAYERLVEVSSECGNPPSRFCTAYLNERNDQLRNCHICDSQHHKKRHPAAYLTDANNSNSPTCWVSAPISAPNSSSAAQPQENGGSAEAPRLDNVTLVLNLDKKYEIIYISLQFCSLKPDSLAILKSADFGRSWTPYQFYSSQCRRLYGRPSRQAGAGSARVSAALPAAAAATSVGASQTELEANCVNSSSLTGGGAGSSTRIAFSTLDGRLNGGQNLDRSAQLQEWITATNIKLVFDRHQASWIQSNLHPNHHHHHQQAQESGQQQQRADPTAAPNQGANSSAATSGAASASADPISNQLTSPSDTFNYAMSDLTVGGRCKCNGHASRCVHSKDGRLQCDCRHNTAGRDCEKCAPFHFDRPWNRATQLDANPCQPCNCNRHSRKCKFDAELYRLSGKRSGGVCIGCRDNTAGRYCHYCKEGFTRDHSKPMSDKEACKACDCHPIGSLGRVCSLTTGQCACKEGVSGLQCNRCAPGYQQSSSLTEPCIKLPENDINYEPSLTALDGDEASSSEHSEAPISGAEQSMGAAGDTSGDAAQQHPRAPSAGRQFGGRNSIADSADDNETTMEQDKDDDESDEEASLSRKQMRASVQQQWLQRQKQHFHRLHNRNRQHQQQFDESPLSQADEDESADGIALPANRLRPQLDVSADIGDDDYPMQSPVNGHNIYQYDSAYSIAPKQRYLPDFRSRRPQSAIHRSRQQQQGDLLAPPIASLDHGADFGLMDEQLGPQNYAPISSSLYNNNNDDAFNQIQNAAAGRRLMQAQHRIRAHQGSSRHRTPFETDLQSAPAGASNDNNPTLGSCGDCQTGLRRLGTRQFCHLDYAIKATILNKYMAQDWTKFEVEIQDIFKSPAAAALSARGATSAAPSNYILNDITNQLQADESLQAPSSWLDASAGNRSAEASRSSESQPVSHRIKVGTVQSIWVPTEDLACKCPRLKLRSSYLLMGSFDAKENSANTLQLDRHGVALEWKSRLQDKLMRYQRHQSRGRC